MARWIYCPASSVDFLWTLVSSSIHWGHWIKLCGRITPTLVFSGLSAWGSAVIKAFVSVAFTTLASENQNRFQHEQGASTGPQQITCTWLSFPQRTHLSVFVSTAGLGPKEGDECRRNFTKEYSWGQNLWEDREGSRSGRMEKSSATQSQRGIQMTSWALWNLDDLVVLTPVGAERWAF